MNLQDLARQVADALGFEWTYQEPPERRHWEVIAGPDGAAISLRIDKGQLRISGKLPDPIHDYDTGRDWWPPSPRPAIGCAATKSPAKIARDITRRLLPEYLPLYRESLNNKERYLEYVQRGKILLAELAAVVPGTESRRGKGYLSYDGPYQPHGNFEIRAGVNDNTPTVALDLSGVPVGTAKEILGLLARRIEEDASDEIDH